MPDIGIRVETIIFYINNCASTQAFPLHTKQNTDAFSAALNIRRIVYSHSSNDRISLQRPAKAVVNTQHVRHFTPRFEHLVYLNAFTTYVNSTVMNTSGERLRALLRECHLSATDFAANRKVTPQHVNNWFKRGIPLARMEEVAELLTVNARWLRTGEGPKHPHDPGTGSERLGDTPLPLHSGLSLPRGDVELPMLKERESETPGTPTTGKKIRLPLNVLQSMNIHPDNAMCMAMVGNSMAEKVQDGSLIGIDRGQTRVIDGEMYALEHSGMLRVKYLYRLPGGGLRLRSHNHGEYPDEFLTAAHLEQQQIRILGWVFWWSTLNVRRHAPVFR